MKLKHLYTLLCLVMVLYFVPAAAQQTKHKKTTKAPAKKVTAKVTKPAPKPAAKTTTPTKAEAKDLGDAAAKTSDASIKKEDAAKPNTSNNSLFEELVVTTAYKPVLA